MVKDDKKDMGEAVKEEEAKIVDKQEPALTPEEKQEEFAEEFRKKFAAQGCGECRTCDFKNPKFLNIEDDQ